MEHYRSNHRVIYVRGVAALQGRMGRKGTGGCGPTYTSQECSGCGPRKTDLTLFDGAYICAQCGLIIDRDRNAAWNILARGKALMSGLALGRQRQGSPQKPPPVGVGSRHDLPLVRPVPPALTLVSALGTAGVVCAQNSIRSLRETTPRRPLAPVTATAACPPVKR